MHPKRVRSLGVSPWTLSSKLDTQAAESRMGQQRSLHTRPVLLTPRSHRAKGKGLGCLGEVSPSRQAATRSQIGRCTQLVPQGPVQALWGPSAGSRLWPGGGQVHQAALLQAWMPAASRPLLPTASLPAMQPSQLWLQPTRPAGTWRLLRALLRRGKHRQLGSCRRPSRAASSVGGLGGVGKRPPRQPLPRSW